MLRRKVFEQILAWKATKTRQALLITGARQVGKTYIVREFARQHYANFVEINLIDDTEACRSFNAAVSGNDLLARITVAAKTEMVPGKTLVFIDEVQEAKEAVTFIKFLVERDDYDYVLSGSMLGVEMKSIRSVPVGYLHTITMYPLDFEEFCWANGLNTSAYDQMLGHFHDLSPVEDYLHTRLLNLYHQYLIIGGMPEPVSQFIETDNIQIVRTQQQNIVEQYRRDISRYSTDSDTTAIRRIFDLIPSELSQQNKRFVVKSIDGRTKLGRNENSFMWLVEANVALPSYNVSEPRHPLLLSKKSSYFKLFLSDVGLLTCLCGMDVVRSMMGGRLGVNRGALYENAVAQELVSQGRSLFYYKNKKAGELDFVIEQPDGEVIPIEVKSGKDYRRHRALKNVLAANPGIERAFVFHEGNLSSDGLVHYLPIYMVTCLSNR